MRSANATGTLVFTILSSLAAMACSDSASDAGDPSASLPAHVAWAELAVDTIHPDDNEYGNSPSFIEWAGRDGAAQTRNRSVCATFVTMLLSRAYDLAGPDFTAWTGSTSPNAGLYHDIIRAENGFQGISMAADIEVGDILAIKYPAGSPSTGHVMVAVSAPVLRAPTPPLVPGTTQYEITIIDSSSSPHGPGDTRSQGGGTFDTGVGQGALRIYADSVGNIVGHTWSTESASTYYCQDQRDLAVGRLVNIGAEP
jgi:hypothetical protein